MTGKILSAKKESERAKESEQRAQQLIRETEERIHEEAKQIAQNMEKKKHATYMIILAFAIAVVVAQIALNNKVQTDFITVFQFIHTFCQETVYGIVEMWDGHITSIFPAILFLIILIVACIFLAGILIGPFYLIINNFKDKKSLCFGLFSSLAYLLFTIFISRMAINSFIFWPVANWTYVIARMLSKSPDDETHPY